MHGWQSSSKIQHVNEKEGLFGSFRLKINLPQFVPDMVPAPIMSQLKLYWLYNAWNCFCRLTI